MVLPTIGAESGLQMLSRLSGNLGSNVTNLQPDLFPPGLIKPHEVVEVWGPDSVAVSRLCTHFLSRCLLPSNVGGLAADAIFIDTQHQMRIHELAASLELSLRKGGIGQKEIPKLLKMSLNQLLILSCFNSTQLLSSIHSLPQLIRARQSKVALVVIDSPAAFYLPDLLTEDPSKIPSKGHYLAEMLSPILKSEINQLNILLIITLPSNYKKSFVATQCPSRSHSVHIKETNQIPSETGGSRNCPNFQVTIHSDKAFVLRKNLIILENEEVWE